MTREKNIAFIALFAALIAALGLIPAINMPWGVPVTAQSLGVMLAGAVLGAKRGFLSVLLFVALVALGLPLLAGGRGGLGVFASPTAGFVIGFPIAAFFTGLVMEKLNDMDVRLSAGIGAFAGGVVALYICGIFGFWAIMNFSMGNERSIADATFVMSVYIPGDLIKVIATALVTHAIYRARPQYVLTRA